MAFQQGFDSDASACCSAALLQLKENEHLHRENQLLAGFADKVGLNKLWVFASSKAPYSLSDMRAPQHLLPHWQAAAAAQQQQQQQQLAADEMLKVRHNSTCWMYLYLQLQP